MLKRFLIGLIKGAVIGGLVAALCLQVLGLTGLGGVTGYLLAIVTGALAGFIAGKPPWAKDGFVEATLKALVGALVGGAALYGVRKWLPAPLEFGPLGSGALGELPAVLLPAIAIAIGIVFELDNTDGAPGTDKTARLAPARTRVPGDSVELDETEPELPAKRARSKS